MKKIIIFTFLVITIFTYSEVKEVVRNSKGENVVLLTDNTWVLENKFENLSDFESKIKLSNLKVSSKRNDGRTLTGTITNQSRKKLEYVTYNVIWNKGGQYSIIRTFTIKNLDRRESQEFKKRVELEGISGRDYKIEVLNFKWAK